MIKYSFSQNSIKSKIKEICWVFFKKGFYITIASILLTIIGFCAYFLFYIQQIIGVGITFGILSVIFIFRLIFAYKKFTKLLFDNFKENALHGVNEYEIEKQDDFYKVKLVNTNKSLEFREADIHKLYFTKNLIVVTLNSNKVIYFPKQVDIQKLFEDRKQLLCRQF